MISLKFLEGDSMGTYRKRAVWMNRIDHVNKLANICDR